MTFQKLRKNFGIGLTTFAAVTFVLSHASINSFASEDINDSGLVINALGDSITYGCGAEDYDNLYAQQIGTYFGADTVNSYAVPGSPISASSTQAISEENNQDVSFVARSNDLDKNADVIFVFGGTNDYGTGVPLGNIEDETEDTFYGSLHLLYGNLAENYPDSKVIALTPLKRYDRTGANEAGAHLEEYVNAIHEVAGNYENVDVIDLYNAQELDFTREENKDILVDGLHPNDEGQDKIACYVVTEIENRIESEAANETVNECE